MMGDEIRVNLSATAVRFLYAAMDFSCPYAVQDAAAYWMPLALDSPALTRAEAEAALDAARKRLSEGHVSPPGERSVMCLDAALAGLPQPEGSELVAVRIGRAVDAELRRRFPTSAPSDAPAAAKLGSGSVLKLTPDELDGLRLDLFCCVGKPVVALCKRIAHYQDYGSWPRKRMTQAEAAARSEAESLIKATVAECMAALRGAYKFPRDWSPPVKITWAAYAVGANADDKRIWLAPMRWMTDESPKHCPEYKRIRSDPVIGEAWYPDWLGVLRSVTAHEVAHIVQRNIAHGEFEGPMRKEDYLKAHGCGWRDIYRELRTAVVNPHRVEAPADEADSESEAA